ncbi:LLM class flavin-dependent oxidoreductase [Acidovorax sp. T1]|uniref:LLM class flavin-dependent oxidoreductase n=1 Tax=Acidovorax sp. T1 TaxID=1858609 RepID=UPI0012FA9794|nr:LLM class flavin-dependent oxidoreductase [Acidovorax sp. T1]
MSTELSVKELSVKDENFVRLKEQYPELETDENGMTHRERFLRRRLSIGLFLPTMSGGGSGHYPSALDLYAPTWDYNLECAARVDELGWDFIFPVGRWRGDGGDTHFQDFQLDVVSLTSGLAARTKRCMVFTTWHVLYGYHPMHVAKIGAGIDHVSGGRWGLNVVAGFKPSEVKMFGLPFVDREERYEMADEFVSMVKQLWDTEAPIDLDGKYYRGEDCIVLPGPVQDPRPLIINAGQSSEGFAFATRHADVVFIQGGSGSKSDDVQAVGEVVQRVRAVAAEKGRTLKVLLPVVLLARDTEEEALELRQRILDHADYEAAQNMLNVLTSGSALWAAHTLEPVVLGLGGFKLIGTPEKVADTLEQLSNVGVDGVQIILFDYKNDIEYFAKRIQPLLDERGLRDVI